MLVLSPSVDGSTARSCSSLRFHCFLMFDRASMTPPSPVTGVAVRGAMDQACVHKTASSMHPTDPAFTMVRMDFKVDDVIYSASFRVNKVANCAENRALTRLRSSWDEPTDHLDQVEAAAARSDCWALVVKTEAEWLAIPTHPLPRRGRVYFQVLTEGESLRAVAIDQPCIPDQSRAPTDNVLPHLPVFSTGQVTRLEKLGRSAVFKVSVSADSGANNAKLAGEPSGPDGARLYIEKSIDCATFVMVEELNTLARMVGEHPNVVRLVGLIAPETQPNKVCGMLLSYVPGLSLQDVGSATQEQKTKWVAQLTSAIGWLHAHKTPIFWGDVKPENIIVHDITGDLVLFDFDGGHTEGWVPGGMAGTKAGDLHGQAAIENFIQDLPLAMPTA